MTLGPHPFFLLNLVFSSQSTYSAPLSPPERINNDGSHR